MIRLARPYITEEAIEAVSEVLRSGNLIQGQNVKKLEEELQDYLQVKHALLVSSGTAALHLAMMALDIGPGDEVIVPAFTYTATANAVEVTGAKAVLVDISTDDFCIDASLIEAKLSSKTKAIMPVHEFGQPADCARIIEIANANGLPIVEDAACAFGASFEGKMAGSIGDIGCFSLHPRKAITTGEGGILTTNSDSLAERLGILRNHGIKPKEGKLDFVEAGLNYRLTDFQAALGIWQLKAADYLLSKRLEAARYYDEALKDIPWLQVPKTFPERNMVYQSYHLLIDESLDRDKLISTLRDKGIETNLGAQNVSALTYYKNKYGYSEKEFPEAFAANTRGLVLPLGEHLSSSDLEYVAKTLSELT